jgi:hypothetical protein
MLEKNHRILVDAALEAARDADAAGRTAQADALDRALIRVAQAQQGQPASVAEQIEHLYSLIKTLNDHYSQQFKVVSRQLLQIKNGKPGDTGGPAQPDGELDPYNPQLNIAPGAQVTMDAQNAATVNVNTV